MTSVLALDCSTTAAKAAAFDADGNVLASGKSRLTRSSPHPGWAEQSAVSWWHASSSALREVMRQLTALGETPPEALCITHQRETFVLLDSDGEEIRPAILWLDTRARHQIEEFGTAHVHQISGKPPGTTPSLYKLLWLRENEPHVFERAAKLLDVHGYLTHQMTGKYVTSTGSADPLSLSDMKTFMWSKELIALVGLTQEQLPHLVSPGVEMGRVTSDAAAETLLPVGLPVIAGAGDGQCGGLGAAVVQTGDAYLSLGTSITLGVHSNEYATSNSFRTLSSPSAGSYTFEGLIASGALSISWFREKIAQLEDTAHADQYLGSMAETAPLGSRGLLFLPYLTSAETPYWDADARGAFVGLGDYHGIAELIRSVFEGLALEVRLLLESIEKVTEAKIRVVTAMGGASQSHVFCQILSDVLNRQISIASETETVALGAAILAAYGCKLEGQRDLATIARRMSGVSTTYAPIEENAERYTELYCVYKMLYPSLKQTFHQLASFRQ